MNLYEYQGQGHSLTLVQGHSDSTFSNFFSLDQLAKPTFRSRYAHTPQNEGPMDTVASIFSLETARPIKAKFTWSLH